MPRVFSGIQPTGDLHLGNYLGAIRNWVADQDEFDSFFCVVDLHAMTAPGEPTALAEKTRQTAALLLAAGLDPKRCTLFVQSHIPAHAELTWILNCVTSFGELRRMTQFKEKSAGQEAVSVGLFDYPVLMAADILAYATDRVPVGDDQRQHLELARNIAQRFNYRFGETLAVPEAAVPRIGARVMDLQNPRAKMSKSAESSHGTVLLLDPPEVVTKKFKVAVTDSGRDILHDLANKPGVSNLLEILAVVTGKAIPELERELEGFGYGDLKTTVAEAVIEFLRPLRERYEELGNDWTSVDASLGVGAEKAKAISSGVMERVRAAVSLLPRRTP